MKGLNIKIKLNIVQLQSNELVFKYILDPHYRLMYHILSSKKTMNSKSEKKKKGSVSSSSSSLKKKASSRARSEERRVSRAPSDLEEIREVKSAEEVNNSNSKRHSSRDSKKGSTSRSRERKEKRRTGGPMDNIRLVEVRYTYLRTHQLGNVSSRTITEVEPR